MATLTCDVARRLLQDGFTLLDAPGGHTQWKIGRDTVRDVTVQYWLNHGDIKATSPGVYVWIGKQPAFAPVKELS
jgi:hypothetical protein